MPLPELTSLQFLVLGLLMDGEWSGRDLRDRLRAEGIGKTAPAFYQLMARLEEAGFVLGHYEIKKVDGTAIKERRYRLTGCGLSAYERTQSFYSARPGVNLLGGLV